MLVATKIIEKIINIAVITDVEASTSVDVDEEKFIIYKDYHGCEYQHEDK